MEERYKLLKDGDYPATIRKVEPKISSGRNNMYVVYLDVYDINGGIHTVKDFWIFSRNMIWKVIHAANACGLAKEYENKTFTPDIIEKSNCVVYIRKEDEKEIPLDKLQGKPPGSKYPAKNIVFDYVVSNATLQMVKPKVDDGFQDKDIPF